MSEGLTRRHALGAAAVVGVAVPSLSACGASSGSGATGGSTGSNTGGSLSATKEEIPSGSGKIFPDAGVVVTQPKAGTFHGFTIVCTHQGCQVNSVTSTINCPCHGSKYSIEDGSVVSGPAPSPLTMVPLTVSGDTISKA